MILASVFLVLVGCTTLVIGVRDSSVHVVYISIGCTIVAGAVLVQSVRGGSEAGNGDDEGTEAEDPPWPPDHPVQWAAASGVISAPGASDAPPAEGSPGPDPAVALIAPPSLPPTPRPAMEPSPEPALGLMAPGPGVLGRLRRRPLAGGESPRQPQTTRPDGLGPPARRSGGEACSAGSRPPRPRSASAPKKAGAGRRKAAEPKAPAVPGPPGARGGGARVAGKAAAKKAARSTGPSGPARQASRNGKGPASQARSPQKAVRK